MPDSFRNEWHGRARVTVFELRGKGARTGARGTRFRAQVDAGKADPLEVRH